jgi:predicted Zn-dependent protease
MSEPTNETINRYLHEQVMKKCWHENADKGFMYGLSRCANGDHVLYPNPDYCSGKTARLLIRVDMPISRTRC